MKSGIWQVHWLELVGMYLYAKYYQNIPNGESAMAIFANLPQTDRRMEGQTELRGDDNMTLFESEPFNRSAGRTIRPGLATITEHSLPMTPRGRVNKLQSTLIISKSNGLFEILRDIAPRHIRFAELRKK